MQVSRKVRVTLVAMVSVGLTAGGIAVADNRGVSDPPAINGLAHGDPVAVPDQFRTALTNAAADYAPEFGAARSLPAPDRDDRWIVIPAVNDGLCMIVGEAATCGPASSISDGRFGLMLIAAPEGAAAERDARSIREAVARHSGDGPIELPLPETRTAAIRFGIVADDVVEVRALNASGRIIHTSEVKANLYRLPLGLEGDTRTVELVGADGGIVASHDL